MCKRLLRIIDFLVSNSSSYASNLPTFIHCAMLHGISRIYGYSVLPSKAVGCVVNLTLDLVLIGALGLGTVGAATATASGQVESSC